MLIELAVILVIVGLLAAVAGPQLNLARERTYVGVMRAGLSNFATAEESYFYDHSVYSPRLDLVTARGFETSKDVQLVVNEATSTGWSATASHAGTPRECYLFAGSAAPPGNAHKEGEIACS